MNGKIVRYRKTVAAALVVGTALLTGCTVNFGAPAEESATEVNAAAEESEVASEPETSEAPEYPWSSEGPYIPELGTFDRSDPGFTQFNPCTEIPGELLAEAGFGDSQQLIFSDGVDDRCRFQADPRYGEASIFLYGGRFELETFEILEGEVYWGELEDGYPVLHYISANYPNNSCMSAIETLGGTIELSLYTSDDDDVEDTIDLCQGSKFHLQEVLRLDGK